VAPLFIRGTVEFGVITQSAMAFVGPIDARGDEARVAYEGLTLLAAGNAHVLVRELSATIPRGTRVLITGSNEVAKAALFRATAGLWENGRGRIVRPGGDDIQFLPERPYLPPGTLREGLVRMGRADVEHERIVAVLRELDLDGAVERAGGPDVERDWDDTLPLGE